MNEITIPSVLVLAARPEAANSWFFVLVITVPDQAALRHFFLFTFLFRMHALIALKTLSAGWVVRTNGSNHFNNYKFYI